jgi:hypothetical protein
MRGKEIVHIGKDMYRITVKSESLRFKMSKITGVEVHDNRVYFHEPVREAILNCNKTKRAKKKEAVKNQLNLF